MLDLPLFGADLVRLAPAHGDRRLVDDVAAATGELAARNDIPSLTGAALRCRGLAAGDADLLLAAAAEYANAGRPLEHALSTEDAGMALAGQGRTDRAREPLESAALVYERLDATRDPARAQAALRQVGVRRGSRGARKRPQIGWPSLTPTERTVAGLAAEGLSNPQIGERWYVSRRTVQTHLAHVFAKLDLTSRAQLAAEVERRRAAAAGPR